MISDIAQLDQRILEYLYQTRELTGSYFFIAFTEIGSISITICVAACVCVYLLWKRLHADFAGFAVAMSGTAISVYVLKLAFERPRPDPFFQAYPESGYSLPSGHAADAAVLYGSMYVLASKYTDGKLRAAVQILCIFLIFMIGFSRVYLGVHFVSDIAAGYALGLLFTYFGVTVSNRLRASDIFKNLFK